jgi:CTP:molybdopterin cytidylyltransferase MocA
MFSSFKKGLSFLDEKCRGVMMLFGDMPYISAEVIDKLLNSWEENLFVIPRVGGTLTHPRIVPSVLFKDFMKIPDNGKGFDIIKRYGNNVREIVFEDNSMFRDIDSLSP